MREFETRLLLAIGELGPDAYGLAIHERLEALTGRSIALGQIYTSLARLEQRRLVAGTEVAPTTGRAGRARKFYQLMPPALRELRSSADSYGRLVASIRRALLRLERSR